MVYIKHNKKIRTMAKIVSIGCLSGAPNNHQLPNDNYKKCNPGVWGLRLKLAIPTTEHGCSGRVLSSSVGAHMENPRPAVEADASGDANGAKPIDGNADTSGDATGDKPIDGNAADKLVQDETQINQSLWSKYSGRVVAGGALVASVGALSGAAYAINALKNAEHEMNKKDAQIDHLESMNRDIAAKNDELDDQLELFFDHSSLLDMNEGRNLDCEPDNNGADENPWLTTGWCLSKNNADQSGTLYVYHPLSKKIVDVDGYCIEYDLSGTPFFNGGPNGGNPICWDIVHSWCGQAWIDGVPTRISPLLDPKCDTYAQLIPLSYYYRTGCLIPSLPTESDEGFS